MKKISIFKYLHSKPITRQEILEIAKRQKKNPDEVEKDIIHAISDLKYSQKEIEGTIKKNKYQIFPDKRVCVGSFGKKNEFNDYYLCHDQAQVCRGYPSSDIALVTGFGPTNSPTAGTLSIIFRLLEIQKRAGIYCHVIISDLGALNSRKKSLSDLLSMTFRFKLFIEKLGFDSKRGEIRTHNSFDMLRTSTLTSSVLGVSDFEESKEATEDMYKRLKLTGNDFSTMVDKNFTVADILLPIIRDGKKIVLVSAGLEEHYYPRLSRIVIERMMQIKGLNEFVKHKPTVCAVYGKIIEGFSPYVKMSKSIPDSSINIGNSDSEIRDKILNCGERNEHVILQMMALASNWDYKKIKYANDCYNNRKISYADWELLKKEYLKFFLEIKKIWNETNLKPDNIKNNIFK